MSEKPASNIEIHLPIESVSFQVKVGLQTFADVDGSEIHGRTGKRDMVLKRDGIDMITKSITGKKTIEAHTDWSELRQLDVNNLPKNEFKADFGEGNKKALLKVRILEGDMELLRDILTNKVPEKAKLKRCQECGDCVEDGTCIKCGKKESSITFRKGMTKIMLGLVISIGAIILTETGRSSASAESTYYIYYGAAFVGVGLIIRGFIKVITGK